MSIPIPAEAITTTTPARPSNSRSGPLVSSVVSGLLLWTTFPPIHWGWLAWVALVPLLLLVKNKGPRWAIYLGAWGGGYTFWVLALHWVRLTDQTAWVAWLTMALALSCFWPLFLAITRLAVLKLKVPLMLAAPLIWVADEYVRAYFVTGFPWYYLAHSQHTALTLIQVADVTGSLGISFVIVLVNAWIVELLTTPLFRPSAQGTRVTLAQRVRFSAVLLLMLAILTYGTLRMSTAKFREGPRVAMLQSSLIQRYKEGKSPTEILGLYRLLVQKAGNLSPRPDLIVWPETSYPFSYTAIDPKISEEDLQNQLKAIGPNCTSDHWKRRARDIEIDLHGFTDSLQIPMLVGSLTYDHRPLGLSKYNSAILFEPKVASVQSYHKLHLVPFGEYVPLIEQLPWLTVFTPYHGSTYIPSLTFGREPIWIQLGNYKIATAICFEDTVPHVVRRFFSEVADGKQPDVLLNLSNDGWFHGSAEHDMHLAISIFRAVENRVPLARAVNTGISAIVDGNGRILDRLPKLKEGVVSGVIPLDDREALYSRWGDWLGRTSLAITIGFLGIGGYRNASKRRRLTT